jgi:predicted component of type VI protein secretion system
MNPITANILQRTIAECIENFEPRARLVSVSAAAKPDANSYEVTISFYVVNVPGEIITLTTMLERSR